MKFERELISLSFYRVGNNLVYSSPSSEPLTAEQMGEVLKNQHRRCSACPIACGNGVVGIDGETSSVVFEPETPNLDECRLDGVTIRVNQSEEYWFGTKTVPVPSEFWRDLVGC